MAFRIFCCKINFELVLKRLKKADKRRTTVMIWWLKALEIWIFNWPFTIDNFGCIEIIQADIKTNYRSQPYSPLQNKSILFVPSQFPLHCLCFLSSFSWQRSDTTPCHTVGTHSNLSNLNTAALFGHDGMNVGGTWNFSELWIIDVNCERGDIVQIISFTNSILTKTDKTDDNTPIL